MGKMRIILTPQEASAIAAVAGSNCSIAGDKGSCPNGPLYDRILERVLTVGVNGGEALFSEPQVASLVADMSSDPELPRSGDSSTPPFSPGDWDSALTKLKVALRHGCRRCWRESYVADSGGRRRCSGCRNLSEFCICRRVGSEG